MAKELHPVIKASGMSEDQFYSTFPTRQHWIDVHAHVMGGMMQPMAAYGGSRYSQMGGGAGVVPDIMPAMYPTGTPIRYQDVDMPTTMQSGGYNPQRGYHYDGEKMVKTKGTGTWDAGQSAYFECGGSYTGPVIGSEGWQQVIDEHNNKPVIGGLLQPMAEYGGYSDNEGDIDMMKKGGKKNWIKGAVNPAHKGYCTPMTKSTCTPRRKAFAMTMKKHHGFHKGEYGGNMEEDLSNPFHPIHRYMQAGGDTDPKMTGLNNNQTVQNENSNTQDTMNQVYQPVQNAGTPPQQGGYAANQDATYDTTGITDQQSNQPSGPTGRQKAAYWGRQGTNLLGAGLATASYFENRKNQRDAQGYQRQLGQTDNASPKVVNQYGHGQTDQWGYNRPMNTMSQTPSMNTVGQTGGYMKNQVVEMDESEMNRLIKMGYKLQKV